MKTPDDAIAIAHRVLAHEDFDDTARILLKLLNDAQSKFPGAKRYLYLDIDGHRNSKGRFDQDMLELQTKFMEDLLIQFLIGADTPLALKQAHCDPSETGPRKNLENFRKISRSHTPLPSAAPANGLWPAIFGLGCGFGRFFMFDRNTSCVVDSTLKLGRLLYSTSTSRWSRSQVAKKSLNQLLYPRTR